MSVFDPDLLRFSYRCSYSGIPGPDQEPEDYPMLWEFTISDLEDGREIQVGEGRFYIIADVAKIDTFDVLDSAGQELSPLGKLVQEQYSDLTVTADPDLMFLSWLEIDPRFRGRKLGHYVLTAILSTVGRSVSTVALKAAPVLGDGGPEEGTPEHRQACAALKKHWRSYGFKPAGKKYLTLNTAAVKALNK